MKSTPLPVASGKTPAGGAEPPSPVAPLFTADAATLGAACRSWLAQAADALAEFKALPVATPFAEVVARFDAIGQACGPAAGMAGLFFQVHPQPELREVAAGIEQELSRFTTALSLDRAVYERLAALDLQGEEARRDPAAARLVEHALRDFRRAGVDRDDPVRRRVVALREELVSIAQEFSRRIAADVRTVDVPGGREGLAGLPEDFVAAHAPDAQGRVTVSTNPTDFVPVMKYATRRELRRAMYMAYMNRGTPDNLAVLDRMIARRHELAGLLGYDHWAAYVTEDKMIRSEPAARAFVQRVIDLTGPKLAAELAELREEATRQGLSGDDLRDYDRMFLVERLRERKFAWDSRQARPFFPFERVRQGVLDTAARLFGLTFEPQDVPLWHSDVTAWRVLEQGRVVARFYLDMHPRPDKFKHAAMFDAVAGLDGRRLPEATLVCNVPRPDGDDPGLLEPSDVITFFHEFGHLLHHLLAGRQRFHADSGIATEWDFVEVPSQLFEEWARDPEVLGSFALHHATAQPIPPELVARMSAAGDYGKGLNARIQMFYATLALDYFSRDPAGLDTTAVLAELRTTLLPFPHEPGTAFQAAFGHLEGYSALYYTYMWSLVLAKDVFGSFKGRLFDAEQARRYRQYVLEPGGSRDAAELLADFLGRPYDFKAFERWLAA